MATIQEAIKRLRYVFISEGADKVVSDQNKVTSAVVGSTTSQEKASLSLDKTFSESGAPLQCTRKSARSRITKKSSGPG
jgi:hypothetical protein